MFTARWRNEPWRNIDVNTVSHGATASLGAVPWMSAWGTAPYRTTSCASGPLHNDPPWVIASM